MHPIDYIKTVGTILCAIVAAFKLYEFILKRRRKSARSRLHAALSVICIITWVACLVSLLAMEPLWTMLAVGIAVSATLLAFFVNPAPVERSDIASLAGTVATAAILWAGCVAVLALSSDSMLLDTIQTLVDTLRKAVK